MDHDNTNTVEIVVKLTVDLLYVYRDTGAPLIGAPVNHDDLVAHAEEAAVHLAVADMPFITSAVLMRPHNIGPSRLHDSGIGYTPDEKTRQER